MSNINIHNNISSDEAFSILGISPFATFPEIKRAYYDLALKFHPDKQQQTSSDQQQQNNNNTTSAASKTGREKAEEKFKMISAAYEKLKEENSHNASSSSNTNRRSATSQSFYNTSSYNNNNHHHTPRRTPTSNTNQNNSNNSFFPRSSPRFDHPYMGVPKENNNNSATRSNPYFKNMNPEDLSVTRGNTRETSSARNNNNNSNNFPFHATPSKPRSCASMEEPLPPSPDTLKKEEEERRRQRKKFRQQSEEEIKMKNSYHSSPPESNNINKNSPEQKEQKRKADDDDNDVGTTIFHNDSSAPSGYTLSPNAVDALNRLKRRHEAAQQFAKKSDDAKSTTMKDDQDKQDDGQKDCSALNQPPAPPARSNKNPSAWVEDLFHRDGNGNKKQQPQPGSPPSAASNKETTTHKVPPSSNFSFNNNNSSWSSSSPPQSRNGVHQQRPESARLPNTTTSTGSRPVSSSNNNNNNTTHQNQTSSSQNGFTTFMNLNSNFDFNSSNNNKNQQHQQETSTTTTNASVSRKNPFGWVDDMCKNARENNPKKANAVPNPSVMTMKKKQESRSLEDSISQIHDSINDDDVGIGEAEEDDVDDTWVEKAFGEIRRKYHEKTNPQQQQHHQQSHTSRRPFSAGIRWGSNGNLKRGTFTSSASTSNKNHQEELKNVDSKTNIKEKDDQQQEITRRLHDDELESRSPVLSPSVPKTKKKSFNESGNISPHQQQEQHRKADDDDDGLVQSDVDEEEPPLPPPRKMATFPTFNKGTFLVPADEVILGSSDEFSDRELSNLIEHLEHKLEMAKKAKELRGGAKKK